jgi:UDP-N-acetylmuramoylalanine--D-glutamate ligase
MGHWTEGGGKRAGILGMGVSGRAAARLLHSRGFSVTGIDSCESIEPCEWCDRLVCGVVDPGIAEQLDGLVLSPGVRPSSDLPEAAVSLGLPVIGEIELASLFASAPILAITGSNGKTTTVEWLGFLLREAGRKACVTGNVGFPFSSAVLDHPDAEFYVVEVSSYQLETIDTFHPSAAAILNVTPDHLRRHGSMDAYLESKAAVFANQHSGDVLVLNAEDEKSKLLRGRSECVEMLFSRTDRVRSGADSADGIITLCTDGERIPVTGIEEISLPGFHNLSNALAVVCMSAATGMTPEEMLPGLTAFKGVPHRIESIAVAQGVEYVNDSKSTNQDSLRVALESFQRRVILLAGGLVKDSDYTELRELIKRKTKHAVLFGQGAVELSVAWRNTVPLSLVSDLEEAFARARCLAVPGDVILLSPGCASFDQYTNFEERGEHFRRLVEVLK